MLKGHTKIELFDAKTGNRTHVQEKDNMVTNALASYYGDNPDGVLNKGGNVRSDTMFPMCPNVLGGILLFPNSLTEDVNNLYAPASNIPVGYASNDINATADVLRGSMNQTESMKIDKGYKFVWDFATSQANGTISALALTSATAGKSYMGTSIASNRTPELSNLYRNQDDTSTGGDSFSNLYGTIDIDFKTGYVYQLILPNTSTIKIRKKKANLTSVGINRKPIFYSSSAEETTITPSTFIIRGDSYDGIAFVNGGDGYWYGFSNNGWNSTGDATVYWIKIKKEDYSYTEGKWTLSGVRLNSIGTYSVNTDYYAYVKKNVCVIDGYLYVINYSSNGIYKINTSNIADITLYNSSFTFSYSFYGNHNKLWKQNGFVCGDTFVMDSKGTIVKTVENVIGNSTELFMNGVYGIRFRSSMYGASNANIMETVFLNTPYLATINNITPVTKTADKTMKITYTVTES